MKARANGKKLAIILDNASLHKSKIIKKFLEKNQGIKLFFLPPYSPEYNPIEQVWKWIKPLVNVAKTIDGGIKELLSRFRKIQHARVNNCLANLFNVGLGAWKYLL